MIASGLVFFPLAWLGAFGFGGALWLHGLGRRLRSLGDPFGRLVRGLARRPVGLV